MIIQEQIQKQIVMDGEIENEVLIAPEVKTFEIFNEVEKETLTGEKVIVKEFIRETNEKEILADIENLRNEAKAKNNKADELENLLATLKNN